MAQAVFRIAKLKTRGNIGAALAHNYRQRPTPNADPRRQNVVLKDGGLDELDRQIGDQKIRSNAVLAVEAVISASPEYFRPDHPDRAGEWDEERLQQWRDQMEPWIRENFPNAISVVLHLDEATPHYQIVDVPLDERGKLNCRGRYGGRETLSNWQTRVAEPVAALGIKRGNEKSAARHVEIASYYGHVNRRTPGIPEVTTPQPKPLPKRSFGESIPATKAKAQREAKEQKREAQAAERKKQIIERNRARLRAWDQVEAKASGYDLAEQQRNEAKVTAQRASDERARLERERDKIREELKQQADRLRELDPGDVLQRLYGATLDKRSRERHRSRQYVLPDSRKFGVSEGKKGPVWIEQGGNGQRGAINLVMHVDGCDFKGAVARLADCYDKADVAREYLATQERRAERRVEQLSQTPVEPPTADVEKWPRVRRWLEQTRGLPSLVIDSAYKRGRVYADRFANAVFPRQSGGAFLRGTGPQKWMRTLGGKHCGPYVAGDGQGDIWLCESPMDALAIKAVHPDATAIATGGNLLGADELRAQVPDGRQVYLAFDRDEPGRQLIEKAREVFPQARVEQAPAPAKDWAEAVQRMPDLVDERLRPRSQAPRQTVEPAQPARPTSQPAPRRRGPRLGG